MVMISDRAKKVLESNIGLPIHRISELSSNDEASYVKTKTGNKLMFSRKYDPRKIGRGNPLLTRKRITTMSEINIRIDALRK